MALDGLLLALESGSYSVSLFGRPGGCGERPGNGVALGSIALPRNSLQYGAALLSRSPIGSDRNADMAALADRPTIFRSTRREGEFSQAGIGIGDTQCRAGGG